MKKEEAIKRFQRMKKVLSIPNSDAERTIEAIDMAIEALSNYTTKKPNDEVEQKNDVVAEPTDLVSRADAIKAIESRQTEQWIDADVDYNNGLESAVAEIKALPSADRPSGEWIKHNDRCSIIFYYTCSECGEIESGTPPYCRKCGAKMGGNK